jgi:hypothetical protein|tara:strand:- start:2390 stop:3058 length:669 start_codon:yes stop_codon:yes gene_type:complete
MKQHFVIKNALDSKTTTLLQDRLFSNSRTLADKKQTFDLYPGPIETGAGKHISIGLTQETEMKENELQSIWNMIEQQVQNSTGKIYPSYGVYNKSVTPMSEHIDSMVGQTDFEQQPAYTIILPLVCHAKCHTVVWDLKGVYPLKFNDPEYTGEQYKHTAEEKTLLSHCDKKVLSWGKPHFYRWNVGDAICISRDNIHASDNFMHQDKGIYKQSILMLTRFQQ